MQPRLLRALETKSFRRVGGERTLKSDLRFVAATNRRLAESVRRGRFREDLYYRLNVVQVRVPPLCERPADIPILAAEFLRRATGNRGATLPAGLSKVLSSHDWPGNARELRNVVERFATFQTTDPSLLFPSVQEESVSERQAGDTGGPDVFSRVLELDYHEAKRVVMDELHQRLLPEVLEGCDGNISEAAKKLGIPRTSLHRMLKKI
jgi:transcriptional regulator with PAS, ATPase and Fis domain